MKRRVLWIVLSCLMFLSSIGLILYYMYGNGIWFKATSAPESETYAEFTYPSIEQSDIEAIKKAIPSATEPTAPEPSETTTVDIPCPVDFDQLTLANPDIIGWIYMEKPEISLPVLRSITDDTRYLYHDAVGKYKREGSLFVEHEYNAGDFSDPVTIIYGHRMSSGSMFGTLQATMSEKDFFNEPRYVYIFTPSDTKIYQIFATLPSDNKHILYYNDFHTEGVYDAFIDGIFSQSGVDVHLISEARPEYGDRILILSSCLWGDRTKRYLVLAKEV